MRGGNRCRQALRAGAHPIRPIRAITRTDRFKAAISHAEPYVRRLKKIGGTFEFRRLPHEGHGIGEPLHRIVPDREQAKWFETHVMGRRPVT